MSDKKEVVLVVEDEFSIRDAISTTLRYEGFEVIEAEDGLKALDIASSRHLDLVILDIMLPKLDGFLLIEKIRQRGLNTPVLIVSAKDDVSDKVHGLSLGADDYVVKPFSLKELMARVNAILRRTLQLGLNQNELRFADIVLNQDSYEVTRSGNKIELTPTEFNILKLFMMRPNKVISKADIANFIWKYDFDGDLNIVEAYISYLRKKLDKFGPSLIHTVRMVGYILKQPD